MCIIYFTGCSYTGDYCKPMVTIIKFNSTLSRLNKEIKMDNITRETDEYLKHLDEETDEYEELLEALRAEPDPEEWEDIIDSMGWGDADLAKIINDAELTKIVTEDL